MDELETRYLQFYREYIEHMQGCNIGKWDVAKIERHLRLRVELDGIARFLALTPEKRKELEKTVAQ